MTDRPDWGHGSTEPLPMYSEIEIREALAQVMAAWPVDELIHQLAENREQVRAAGKDPATDHLRC